MTMASEPQKVSHGRVTPHALPAWKELLVLLVYLLMRTIGCSLRARLDDPSGLLARHGGQQVIFCIWHNRLALCMEVNRRFFLPLRPGRKMAALVSASRDGALVARLLEWFGAQAVRGSSSRRGPQALLELTSWAEEGFDLAITPDGPRGPCYRAQEGAVALAQLTRLPILPVSYDLSWKWQLSSWDRFQIPLPFAVWTVRVGEPILVQRELSDAERELKRQQLESSLRNITRV